jgi:hypothetical protein
MANIWIGIEPREDKNKYKDKITDIFESIELVNVEGCKETDKFMFGWLGINCPDKDVLNTVLSVIALEIPVYRVDFFTENEIYGKNITKMVERITDVKINWMVT